MTVFDDALEVLMESADLSVAALYKVGGTGSGTAIRVIRSQVEDVQSVFDARVIRPAHRLHIRAADLAAAPADGDTVTIGAEILTVRHALRDVEGITWDVTCDG